MKSFETGPEFEPTETNVVVGVIGRERETGETEYLLMSSQKDFGEYTGFLYPPGGHIEGDETEEEAVIREFREELDLKVTPSGKVSESPGDVENQTTHWWKCAIELGAEPKPKNDEVKKAVWLTRSEIEQHDKIWPATRKFFEEHIFQEN